MILNIVLILLSIGGSLGISLPLSINYSYWFLLLLALEIGVVEFFMYGVKSIVGAKRNKKVIKVNWYYTFIMKMFFEE